MVEKQFIIYYQHHLEWLSQLAEAIQQSDRESIPELDAHLCHFGQWLESDAKPIIMNNSKYKEIVHQHQTLHGLGETIAKQLDKKRYDQSTILSYLEKSEMISLTIGTELALIDNTYLIKKVGKDEMTGALNRNSLSNLFASQYELSLATESNFSLAMCDLDHFKGINDTYGHLAGDSILKAFVKIVQETLRDSDVVVRYGGEEFIIILPHTKLEHAIKKLEDLRLNFANHVCNYNDTEFGTTVSIGVIEITPQPSQEGKKISMESYIKEVDELLYHAKSSGRNRITC
jgi:diguanylate cyclase